MAWEAAWSPKYCRWFYQDRTRGLSSWVQPDGCYVKLPEERPPTLFRPENVERLSKVRRCLPPGWDCSLDAQSERVYFYNPATQERAWAPPQGSVAFDLELTAAPPSRVPEALDPHGATKVTPATSSTAPVAAARPSSEASSSRPALGRRPSQGISFAPGAWDAASFKARLENLRFVGDRQALKNLLREVSEHNYVLRNMWPVPRTILIKQEQCACTRLPSSDRDAVVSFSPMSTADALLHFGRMSPGRVCGFNFANGVQVGGGYKNGAMAQEEDLCRRIPALYTSLLASKRDRCYPFGPSTCTSPADPRRYSDVLWTEDAVIARAGEAEGFALLAAPEQVPVCIVSGAAPNLKFANPPEIMDRELLYKALKTVFIAPRLQRQEVHTLIVGAWGCGAFGGDPEVIAELFCRALTGVDRLGRLYKEVHFAIPQFVAEDRNATIFRETLRRHGIPVEDR
eukprot:TRINITY_DN24429_c1_g1_i1.p1 TRINITY_DN24429_c1_g1~~TRINITY_DN24429_c1_g1_i1.p1  ORF type:complete len:457 (-),score=73.15 TRINITY_DN24429_c1_g1_i1:178-1548(-)